MSTSAEGDFRSRKSTIPSGMDVHGSIYTVSNFKYKRKGARPLISQELRKEPKKSGRELGSVP